MHIPVMLKQGPEWWLGWYSSYGNGLLVAVCIAFYSPQFNLLKIFLLERFCSQFCWLKKPFRCWLRGLLPMSWSSCKDLCAPAYGFWIRAVIITVHVASNPCEFLSPKSLKMRINFSFFRKKRKKASQSVENFSQCELAGDLLVLCNFLFRELLMGCI